MKPLIIQSDFTIMLDVKHPWFARTNDDLIKFCEIDQSPDSLFIYKITNISIWNAIAMNITKNDIITTLKNYSQYDLPKNVIDQIGKWYSRYGIVELVPFEEKAHLLKVNNNLRERLRKIKTFTKYFTEETSEGFIIPYNYRGDIKSILMKNDISVQDKLGFTAGVPLNFKMRDKHRTKGFDILVRDYQEESSHGVYVSGQGTVVLPCGSGKTMVGTRLAEKCQTSTLIVTNSAASVRQWKQSLVDFTTLTENQISCYDSKNKEFAPVTVCTYNMLAYRFKGDYIHFKRFLEQNWGLVIMDEVHLMPAAMFRIVSSFQASKRLALTATFVREDGREKDIFTLIGPKRYDKPWKDLEARGYIANISLQEIRVPLSDVDKKHYASLSTYQDKYRVAVMNANKMIIIQELIEKHKDDKILIIGQFSDQLDLLGKQLGIPVVRGKSSTDEREHYYEMMRTDSINHLIASSIANAALDIPGISVVIQVSFQGGSRNEEAQRIGRATRPKEKPAYFYTLVSKDTKEQSQNRNRQLFLTNEGYKYEIKEATMA